MKKLIAIFLCVLLLGAMAVTVHATDSAQLTMKASASTVYRGDTVKVTVSMSEVEDCRSGGITPQYDSSVFELVSGGCVLSNTSMSGSVNGTYSFAFIQGTTVSGPVFVFEFRVKDTAAVGTFSIGGYAAVRTSAGPITAGVSGTSVTVTCDHSYGDWTKVDDANHQRTCALCGKVETAAHGWDGGKVTKAPTCKDSGEKTYTCATCGASKTETLPKTDDHSYGDWTKADDANHQRTCTLCGKVETAAHGWDGGKVTKAPTCKDPGEKVYTCACGAAKTESVPKTDDHSYGAWTKADDATHRHTCTVCGKAETADHGWDGGKVTKAPTCKDSGEKTYTCACGAAKTESVPKTDDHSYGAWTKADDAAHRHTCTVCGKDETAGHTFNAGVVTKKATCKDPGEKTYTCTGCGHTKTEAVPVLTTHTYDHGCDKDCNVCGLIRPTSHSYRDAWQKDQKGHWHQCSVCGEKKDQAAHTPGPAATEAQAQTCTICGYTIAPALSHTHRYADTWTVDDNGHWYACDGCEERGEYAEHDFENDCDTDCGVCGHVRQITHAFGEEWAQEAGRHWHVCDVCGEEADSEQHIPGAQATESTPQTCAVCGWELAPALGTEPPTEAVEQTQPTEPVEKDPAGGNFPWWVVIVAAVAAAGGAALVIVKKKKETA